MSEILRQPNSDKKLLTALGCDPSLTNLEKIDGGFTGAEKYRVDDLSLHTHSLFAKLVRKDAEQNELSAIRAEVRNYHLLSDLGLTGSIFPHLQQEIDSPDFIGLTLDYYDNATWAGPWNETTITAVHHMLSTIHSAELTKKQQNELEETKLLLGDNLISSEKQYAEARLAFHNKQTIVNSRGDIIFNNPNTRMFEALFELPPTSDDTDPILIAQDVNKYNICFDDKGSAHIVDPVYLDLGSHHQDFLNIGHDIINSLPDNAPELSLVKELFIPIDKHNKYVLNGIAYGLMASQMPYDKNPAWMDYQQESLVTKLKLWHDLI